MRAVIPVEREPNVIKIQISYTDQNIRQVRVKGHAGGKSGKDIVCSAVSAVTQTALVGLLHYGAGKVQWEMKKGTLFIEIKNTGPEFSVILNTMYLGLSQIQKEHPAKVRISLIHDTGVTHEA